MNERSTQHATFVIERDYTAPPSRVFAAWSDMDAKSRWFAGPDDWQQTVREFDFRVGGLECLSGVWASGKVSTFESRYQDIVPDQRIVYTYDMHIDGVRISVSLSTIEFKPASDSTHLVYTEQAAFLDGHDDAGSREKGTRSLLDKLGDALSSEDGPS